jgi:hypothetical protein
MTEDEKKLFDARLEHAAAYREADEKLAEVEREVSGETLTDPAGRDVEEPRVDDEFLGIDDVGESSAPEAPAEPAEPAEPVASRRSSKS